MGLLSLGTPLDWHDSKKFNEHVRDNAISQLVNIFDQSATRDGDTFYWGDEVEYMLIEMDSLKKTAKLSLDSDYILNDFNDKEKPAYQKAVSNGIVFHPEYGRFMVEATPLVPYGDKLEDYLYVEKNMSKRRETCEAELPSNIRPFTLTSFFRMGCDDFTSPATVPNGPVSQSLFLSDEIINRHVRFPTLTANIRKRKGSKVSINLPMYPDVKTKLVDDSIPFDRRIFDSDIEASIGASRPGHVYMDAMGFGMGSSCLQVTMQAKNISQARYLYDSLIPLAPLMLSLSGAAPIFKGYLVNQDVRWNVISGAVDDRTFIERDVKPYKGYDIFGGLDVSLTVKNLFKKLGGGIGLDGDHVVNHCGDTAITTVDGKPIQKVNKSRYDSVCIYLGDQFYTEKESYFAESYNNVYFPLNNKVYKRLVDTKLFDPSLAKHFAYLFVRDPLVLFSERINQNNELENDHFENIQSTNWQTLRFKPPALYESHLTSEELSKKPGWRVEFRPMEIQLTDFENAAYSIFITLLSKAILHFKPDFYINISCVEENMKTAHIVDSVLNEKFWFKNVEAWNIDPEEFLGYDLSWFDQFLQNGKTNHRDSGVTASYNGKPCCDASCNECRYSMDQIINGTKTTPGLIHLIVKYVALYLTETPLSENQASEEAATKMLKIHSYLHLISQRASGNIPTIAHWIRERALTSSLYKQDSKISAELAYSIISDCDSIAKLDFERRDLLSTYFDSYLLEFLSTEP